MAQNRSRDLHTELQQGIIDNSYMQLTPNRGGDIEDPRTERLTWPTYAQVERHQPDNITGEASLDSKAIDEITTRGTSTTRKNSPRV